MRGHLVGPGPGRDRWSSRRTSDRYTWRFDPCGSGGRSMRGDAIEGSPPRMEPPFECGVTTEEYDFAWNKKGVCFYCVNCCVVMQLMPIDAFGYPVRVVEPPTYPDDRDAKCTWHVYKDPAACPGALLHGRRAHEARLARRRRRTRLGDVRTAPGRGVAGAGHWATTAHMPAILAHPQASSSPWPTRTRRGSRAPRRRSACGGSSPMRRRCSPTCPMDALVIAAPHVFHHPIAADAIRSRSRMSSSRSRSSLDPAARPGADRGAAERPDVEILVGYTWHYNDQVLTARRWIEDGRLGDDRVRPVVLRVEPVNLYRGEPEADVYAYGAGSDYFGPQTGDVLRPGGCGWRTGPDAAHPQPRPAGCS